MFKKNSIEGEKVKLTQKDAEFLTNASPLEHYMCTVKLREELEKNGNLKFIEINQAH